MGRRSKGEGSLIKIGACRFWYAQFYQNNKQIRVSTRTEVKQEALVILRKLMADRDKGLTPITEMRKITYADLRAGLIVNYIEKGNKSLTVRATGDETIPALKQLDEFFGYKEGADKDGKRHVENPGPPVTQITTDSARDFVRQRQKDGVGASVINRSLAALRRMLKIAYEDRKLQYQPVIRLLKEPPARKGFLQTEKFEELVVLLPGTLKPLITFLYYCGVRIGEALQIEWPQVDLDKRLIRLEEEQTKSGEARYVPLPSVLVMMLRDIQPKIGRVFTDTNLRKEWMRACTAVGLGRMIEVPGKPYDPRYVGLTIHDLRRSAIRNLVNAGVPETLAMRISGHRTRSVFDRYAIASADDLIGAIRRVETANKNLSPISERSVKKLSRSNRKSLMALSSRG